VAMLLDLFLRKAVRVPQEIPGSIAGSPRLS